MTSIQPYGAPIEWINQIIGGGASVSYTPPVGMILNLQSLSGVVYWGAPDLDTDWATFKINGIIFTVAEIYSVDFITFEVAFGFGEISLLPSDTLLIEVPEEMVMQIRGTGTLVPAPTLV